MVRGFQVLAYEYMVKQVTPDSSWSYLVSLWSTVPRTPTTGSLSRNETVSSYDN